MWNYDLIFPELAINLTFLIFYFSQPRLPIKINKAFLFILIVDLLTIISDVCSSWCLDHLCNMPPFLHRVQNVIYFMLFLQRVICFLMFTILILNKDMRKSYRHRLLNLVPFFLICVIVLMNLFTDTIFCISEDGTYSSGPLYNLIYICAYYFVLFSICHVIIFRKQLSHGEFISALSYNIVMLIGYTVRIVFPQYLIMNFFTLISIIIIYLSFENPTLFKEEKSGVFNKKALKAILTEMEEDDYPLIIGFAIHNYNELREIYSYNQTDKGLSLIGNYLKVTFPKLLPFYAHDGRFVLIGKDISEEEAIKSKILQRFSSSWNTGEDIDMFLEVSFTQLKPETFSYNRDILFTTLLTTLNELDPQSDKYIDATDITKIERNMQVKRAVETALEQNTVELFLQPVVDAKTRKLVGAESLARIRDLNGQYIPPFLFIPVAEKNGRINVLGEQMFEKTCEFIKTHDINAMGLSWINVNLSPIQILRRDLNEQFCDILKNYDIPPEMIHLEITEESMIDFDILQDRMQTMKQTGFRFVLDDYGRGYSNVARMKKCPFINIKLDMEFVWDYYKYKDQILPTLVQTIKQMGFTVTAEGIESLEMADALRDIGCDYLQGFCFSKPLSIEEFTQKYQLS